MGDYSHDYEIPPVGTKLLLQKLISVLFLLQLLAGLVLVICGTMSLKMTAGQTDSYGPPYYMGTIFVGAVMLVSGALWSLVYGYRRRLFSRKHRPHTFIVAVIFINHILGLASLIGSVGGVVICALYGLYKCSQHEIYFQQHQCNFTIHIRENHSLAILQLAFLSAAILLSLLIVIVTTWCLRILRVMQCGCCLNSSKQKTIFIAADTEDNDVFDMKQVKR